MSQAYSTGLIEVLNHPLVADEFPYLAYHAVHDSRVRPEHLALERHGLNGTNIYRRDDPIWERFTPPWDYQCRCAIIPMTIEDAARAGVHEAQEWLRTGLPPSTPEWVTPPPFSPPEGWNTRITVRLGLDAEGHEHDRRGRFAPKGNGGNGAPKGAESAKKAAPRQEAQKKLHQDVKELHKTKEGRAVLGKGREIAAKLKSTVAQGVKSALDGIDEESGGGLSLLAGSLKGKDPVAAAAGASRLVSVVYRCVHEEMFELLLSQATGGPAIAAKLAAKGIAKVAVLAESGLVKAAVWAMGKTKSAGAVQMSLEREEREELTAADRHLLRSLTQVVADNMKQVLAAAGASGIKIDLAPIEKRLQAMLTEDNTRLSLDSEGHDHGADGRFQAKKDYKVKRREPAKLTRRLWKEVLDLPLRLETESLIDAANAATDLLPADPPKEHRRRLQRVRQAAFAAYQRLLGSGPCEGESEKEHRQNLETIRRMALWAHKADKRLAVLENHPGRSMRLSLDDQGHAHAPSGTSKGGQFVKKNKDNRQPAKSAGGGGGRRRPRSRKLQPVDFQDLMRSLRPSIRSLSGYIIPHARCSPAFYGDVLSGLHSVPDAFHDFLSQEGRKIVLGQQIILMMPNLKGQQPRGWPVGSTWEEVGGLYVGKPVNNVLIAEKVTQPDGSLMPTPYLEATCREELGHAVDASLDLGSGPASHSDPDFVQAYQREAGAITDPTIRQNFAYLLQPGTAGQEEAFASLFALQYGGAVGSAAFQSLLRQLFPDTLGAVRKLAPP